MIGVHMPVIFLDIDGVLRVNHTLPAAQFDIPQLQLFKNIKIETGARCVLSSTWRLYPRHRMAVRKILNINEYTPDMRAGFRSVDIIKFVEIHNLCSERIVIIDDDITAHIYGMPNVCNIVTDPRVGLTVEHASRVIEFCNSPTLPEVPHAEKTNDSVLQDCVQKISQVN